MRDDSRTTDAAARLQLSTVSGKLDLTSTASTKSPVLLKFNSGVAAGQKGGKTKRKLKWAPGDHRGDKLAVAGDGRSFSDPSDAVSVADSSAQRESSNAGSAHGQYVQARSRLFSAIPEEGSLTDSMNEYESRAALEALDEEIDDMERSRRASAATTGTMTNSGGGVSPALMRVRDRFRAALVSNRSTRSRSEDTTRALRIGRNRMKRGTTGGFGPPDAISDFHSVDVSSTILEDDEHDDEESARRGSARPRGGLLGGWRGSILRGRQHQSSTPSTNAPGSPASQTQSSPQFEMSPTHSSSPPMNIETSAKRKSALRGRGQQPRRNLETPDAQQQHVIQIANKAQRSTESGLVTPRQSPNVCYSLHSVRYHYYCFECESDDCCLNPQAFSTQSHSPASPADDNRDPMDVDSSSRRIRGLNSLRGGPNVRVHEGSTAQGTALQHDWSSSLRPTTIRRSPRSGVHSISNVTGQSTGDDGFDGTETAPPLSARTVASPNASVQAQSPAPSAGGGPPSHMNASSVVSLGLAVRYANAPYGVSKVISFMPRYLFYSRLPFLVLIKDVKTSQTLKLGVSRSSTKEPQVRND